MNQTTRLRRALLPLLDNARTIGPVQTLFTPGQR
jgi:hypothetical protein